ncbi:hypothetical protein STEG23_013933, partial [Scotinomys teguina]
GHSTTPYSIPFAPTPLRKYRRQIPFTIGDTEDQIDKGSMMVNTSVVLCRLPVHAVQLQSLEKCLANAAEDCNARMLTLTKEGAGTVQDQGDSGVSLYGPV